MGGRGDVIAGVGAESEGDGFGPVMSVIPIGGGVVGSPEEETGVGIMEGRRMGLRRERDSMISMVVGGVG